MKTLYEFIGTFFLMFTIGMTVLNPGGVGALAPLAIGSILAVMVYAGGHVSGGHYNPAVSLAVFMRGKLSAKELLPYWAAQCAAALVASFLVLYFKEFPQVPAANFTLTKLFLAEALFTFALCYVVLNVATAEKTAGNSFYGFAIGFTVLAGAYAVGPLSGAAFNPAVALGLSFLQVTPWSHFWVYLAANSLGGLGAALAFSAAHRK